jgi:hypothetical protein
VRRTAGHSPARSCGANAPRGLKPASPEVLHADA